MMVNLEASGEILSAAKLIHAWAYKGTLNVYRSWLAVEHGETFEPIQEIIDEHELSCTSRKEVKDPDMAFGAAYLEVYARG